MISNSAENLRCQENSRLESKDKALSKTFPWDPLSVLKGKAWRNSESGLLKFPLLEFSCKNEQVEFTVFKLNLKLKGVLILNICKLISQNFCAPRKVKIFFLNFCSSAWLLTVTSSPCPLSSMDRAIMSQWNYEHLEIKLFAWVSPERKTCLSSIYECHLSPLLPWWVWGRSAAKGPFSHLEHPWGPCCPQVCLQPPLGEAGIPPWLLPFSRGAEVANSSCPEIWKRPVQNWQILSFFSQWGKCRLKSRWLFPKL